MPVLTVTDELYAQLQQLAADMEHSVEQCQVWALEDFVAEERPKVDAVLEGRRDIAEGRYYTQEQMEEQLNELFIAHELPAPAAEHLPLEHAS